MQKIRGIGGWPSEWANVPSIARSPEFWKSMGLNGYRPMVGTDQLDDLKAIQSYVVPWVERGFHIRLAVNWGRNPPMPDYLACFSHDVKAIDTFTEKIVKIAKFMDALNASWSIEPCQESEVWNVKYGLAPSMWDAAYKDWEFFVGYVYRSLRQATKACIDIGSPVNQSVSGWDSPYWPERWKLPPSLQNVRSDTHFYTPKFVGIDGLIQYPSEVVKASAGVKLTKDQVANAKIYIDKETNNLGPNKKGVAYAWSTYVDVMKATGLPLGVGEVSSVNHQHALDILSVVKGADTIFWWDWTRLFKNGVIDLDIVKALTL